MKSHSVPSDVIALLQQNWTEAEARQVLDVASKSRTLAAFAREHGVSAKRLYIWRDKLRASAPPAPVSFLPVMVPRPVADGAAPVEIRSPGGFIVRVAPDAAVLAVATALRALVEAGC